jgi:hypothetical protein
VSILLLYKCNLQKRPKVKNFAQSGHPAREETDEDAAAAASQRNSNYKVSFFAAKSATQSSTCKTLHTMDIYES